MSDTSKSFSLRLSPEDHLRLEQVAARQRQRLPFISGDAASPAKGQGKSAQSSRRKTSTLRDSQMSLRYGVDDDDLETFREPNTAD